MTILNKDVDVEKHVCPYVRKTSMCFPNRQIIFKLVLCHKLVTYIVEKLVTERKRKLKKEEKMMIVEVNKLMKSSHVHEIQFLTWLFHVMMMKSSNKTWMMCIKFIDFNKICPKIFLSFVKYTLSNG